MSAEIHAGQRFADMDRWEDRGGDGPHVWRTLGFRRAGWEPGHTVLEWDATADYGFPTNTGAIIHGGLVTTVLDSAMGGAAWTVLDRHEVFLTADLRTEFYRAARPATLRAVGRVERRTRRVVFCAGELYGPDDRLLAAARCTQVVLPVDDDASPHDPTDGAS